MDTPQIPFPQTGFESYAPTPPTPQNVVSPDNPPWGILGALGVWILSFLLMLATQLVFLIGYVIYRGVGLNDLAVFITKDPTAIFFAILSIIPAHLLTLGAAWALVTQFGKHPFFKTLGWEWSKGFTFWRSAFLAVGLLIIGSIIIYFFGGAETQLDKIINSSRATAFTTAFLATATAPLVEEVVYRGILYSAFQRTFGVAPAVFSLLSFSRQFIFTNIGEVLRRSF